MEKVSIVIGFNDGEPEIIESGGVEVCMNAYREAIHSDKHDFVGLLRKPDWYKHAKPHLVQKQKDQAHRELEDELKRAEAEAELEAADKAEADAKVEAIKTQLDNNLNNEHKPEEDEPVKTEEEPVKEEPVKEEEPEKVTTPKQSISKKTAKGK